MESKKLRAAIAAALAGSVAATADVGIAQEEVGALEEIVVTATRREQDLQEVPVSIVAITGENLELRGIDNLEEVGAQIPNINIQGGGNGTASTTFRMRGIPNVGTYIDGVWQVNTGGFLTQEFVDIDRIEVLRGPQGTTYGRDSVGGAIRIWTRRPSDEFGANVSATVGSLDRRDVKAVVDLPITDNLLTKWTAASLYRDGYIQSLNIDQKNGGIDQTVFRGDMLWTPTDALSMRFTYSQSEMLFTEPRIQDGIFDTAANVGQGILTKEFYGLAGLEPYEPEFLQAGYPGGQVGLWENKTDITLPNNIKNEQVTWGVELDVSDTLSVQFLTAYTDVINDIYNEWDNSPYVLVNDYNRSTVEVLSEEIQISGGSGRITWVAGLYYWDQEFRSRNMRYQFEEFAGGGDWMTVDELAGANPALFAPSTIIEGQHINVNNVFMTPECVALRAGPLPGCESAWRSAVVGRYDNMSYSDTDGWAIFGDVNIELTDALTLTFGARQHDQTEIEGALAHVPGVTAPKPPPNTPHTGGSLFSDVRLGAESVSFDQDTYRMSLQMQFNDDIMGYISYSEGFDSGGVSSPTIDGVEVFIPYDPQTLENTEIGIRSDLLDGALRLNATVFSSDYTNIQAPGVVFDSRGVQLPTLVTTNVGKAKAEGVELELTVVPTDNLMFNVNVGSLDTAYTQIAPGTLFISTSTEFQQAPESTYNVGMQYNATLSNGGSLTTRVDYSYTDQFWRSLSFLRMSSYSPPIPASYDESGDLGTVNARVTYQPPNQDWSLSVFGTNLTDEYLLNSGFFHGIWGYDFATVARPREAGVTFNFFFD